jgi:hypothetical protein
LNSFEANEDQGNNFGELTLSLQQENDKNYDRQIFSYAKGKAV